MGGPQEDSNLRNKDSSVKLGDGGLGRGLFPALHANRTSDLVFSSHRAGDGECLPSMHQALSWDPAAHKIGDGGANTHRVEAGR